MDKVDVHVHVFDLPSERFPRQLSSLAPADRACPIEALIADMDASGIDRAVLIEMNGTQIEQHAYVTHCVQTWPDRFTATGLIDMNDPDPPARLRELVAATGIEGIRLGALGDPTAQRAEDLATYAVFECADELGLNINIYTGGAQFPCIELLAAAFPDVNISLDHLGVMPTTPNEPDRWGRPRFNAEPLPPANYPQVMALSRFPNVYVKISGEYAFSKVPWPYGDMQSMVEDVYRAYGADRMMWCTDSPWIVVEPGYQKLVDLLDCHLPNISAAEKEMIMGGTAMKLWFKGR